MLTCLSAFGILTLLSAFDILTLLSAFNTFSYPWILKMDSFQKIQNHAFYTSLNPNFFSILKNRRKNPKILRFLDFSALIILFDPN